MRSFNLEKEKPPSNVRKRTMEKRPTTEKAKYSVSPQRAEATHSSVLAWRIPWTVWSMGSQRVRHDQVTFTSQVFFFSKRVE